VIANVGLVVMASTGIRAKGARIFNEKRRKLGIDGPDRAVEGVRQIFRKDEEVQAAVQKGKEIKTRLLRGDSISEEELRLKDAVSLESVVGRTSSPKTRGRLSYYKVPATVADG
jgi:hypothetical protein